MTGSDFTPAVSEVSSNDLVVGSIFADKFEILAKLGQGGMSSVYKARQLQMDRIVALKVMRAKFNSGGTSLKRFQREAQALCTLQHECVVKALTFGTHGQDCFIAMDYIEGITLFQLLQERGRLPWKQVVQIVTDIGWGLAHAHSKGIVHRDIKPGNIMLVQQAGQAKAQLVDFGLAKSVDSDSLQQKLTQTNHLVGTPLYMSPEQCTNGVLDARSDIYSLGCVSYELLTGKPPFAGESPYAIMYGHLHEEPAALPPDTPPWLQQAVFKMIQRDPGSRYQAVSDLVRVLVDRHDDELLAEPITNSWDKVGLPAQLQRLMTKRLGILVLLLVGVLFLLFWAPSLLAFLRDDHQARSFKIFEDRTPRSDEPKDNIAFNENRARVAIARWRDARETDPSVGREHSKYTEAVASHRFVQQLLTDRAALEEAALNQWAFGDRLWEAGKGTYGEDFGFEAITDLLEVVETAGSSPAQSESTLALLLTAEERLTIFQERYGREFPKESLELQRRTYRDLAGVYAILSNRAGRQNALRKWIEACPNNCVERVRVTVKLAVASGGPEERKAILSDALASLEQLEAAHKIRYAQLQEASELYRAMANEFTFSDPSMAEQCLAGATRVAGVRFGEQSAEVAQIQLALANLYMSENLLPKAKSLYVKILPNLLEYKSEFPKETIQCLSQLSKISQKAGNIDDAEKYLLQALQVNRVPSSPYYLSGRETTASWLLEVAAFAMIKKRPHDALVRANSAVQALEGTTGVAANLLRSRAYNLQGLLLTPSDRMQAKAAFLHAWQIEKSTKEISLHAIFTAQQLAAIAELQGDLKLALVYEKEALRICQKVAPGDLRAAATYKFQIERLTKALKVS